MRMWGWCGSFWWGGDGVGQCSRHQNRCTLVAAFRVGQSGCSSTRNSTSFSTRIYGEDLIGDKLPDMRGKNEPDRYSDPYSDFLVRLALRD